ncbi:MAG: peptidase T [Lachnospiraceae bacterium]|nr:peptidase T [Lachnospiraceae bacterium]
MRAYERFMSYAAVHTTSSEESGTHPSFAGEWDLAQLLNRELTALGLEHVRTDEHCYVYGELPASKGCERAPALGLIAHMDTSDAASGKDVKVLVHENYDGKDFVLPSGRVFTVAAFPFLKRFAGETLLTSDGTTLLGADDKAGIAEIMTALEELQRGEIPHGPLRICFTPDEEIGEGADLFDVKGFGAAFAYTVDGGDVGGIEYENFNAASAEVVLHGVSVHPGSAKDIMVNAAKLAMEYQSLLPADECPEKTQDREGFFHLTDISGTVSEARLKYIIRDHDREKFEKRKKQAADAADKMNEKYGDGTAEISIRDQYYNMIEKIRPHMHLIENAQAAIRDAGLEPFSEPVRGGTDGARLSFMGLPCPNLGTGGFNFHGEYECITAERMDRAVLVILNIVRRYADQAMEYLSL